MSALHVKRFLNSIDFVARFFLLAPNSGVIERDDKLPSWRSLTLSNVWVVAGFVFYFCTHTSYVMSNDDSQTRVKLVTFFIDIYNKYSGLLMVTILVVIGYFQQANNARIYRVFYEIERIFLRELRVKIQNVDTLRIVYLQITVMCGAVIYTEYSNCLMYIQPTTLTEVQENCMLLCILPMLVISIVECRLFAYFLLIRERYKIMNQLIEFYKCNISDDSSSISKSDKGVFYITDFAMPPRYTQRIWVPVGRASVETRCFEALKSLCAFLKSLVSFRRNPHSVGDIDEKPINQHINYIDRVTSVQAVYSRLHEIFNLVSAAYGMQIIAIIAVQFITLTTLMYYFTMKLVSLVAPNKDIDKSLIIDDLWSSGLWIAIYLYKVYSLCYCIHVTVDEGIKVGHHIHLFGLHATSLNDKFKIKMFLLQILHERIKFAPFGLFEINLGLFSMIFGAIATYILILIQFDVAQKT